MVDTGQGQGGGGLRSDAFAPSGEAEALGGGRLHAHPLRSDPEQGGEPRRHGRAMGSDLRPFADEGNVDIDDAPAPRGHQVAGMGGEKRGIRAAPLGVRRREVLADVAGGERPQNRVDQGMQSHVGIRMAGQGEIVGDINAAEAHLVARAEAVHVEAGAAPDLLGAGQPARGLLQVRGRGDLEVRRIALDQTHREAGLLGNGRVVGEAQLGRCCAMGGQDLGVAEPLGRLRPPQPVPVHGAGDAARN